MKKFFILTVLVLSLVISGCQNAQEAPDAPGADEVLSPAERPDGIQLLVELRTTSTWSDLKILNSDLILYAEVASLIGEPAYFDLDSGSISLEQSQEAAESGEQVGLIVSLILDQKVVDEDIELEFDLTKGCSNQSLFSIYGVVEDQPRLIYQRELDESEDCGGVAFKKGLVSQLKAMETIGSTNYAKEEVVFEDLEPPTIQNGIEIELITRTDGAWLVDPELPNYEVLAVVGEPIHFGHGGDLVIDLGQTEAEAEVGKWIGARVRLEYDPETEDQVFEYSLNHGCLNETILNFYKVVDGERFVIPNLDGSLRTTVFECVDPVSVQVDLDQNLVNLRYFVLENIHLDEGDPLREGQIFLEAELITNSNWAEILVDDDQIISSQLQSVVGDPRSLTVRLETLQVSQPNSAAGSGLDVGVTARYGFMPGDGDDEVTFFLQNGALNRASVRFFVNLDGERIPIPLRGEEDGITVYGNEGQEFTINLGAVQTLIRASELYDDLPMVAHLSDIRGEVLVRQPGMDEFYPANEGTPLNVGGEVLTGANSEVYLSISDGAVIRLGPNTIFGLEMGINSEEIVMPRFRLELGEMEVVSGSGGFLIITPKEVLGAIGSAALVTVTPDGEASMDCIAGDCFQYDGTADTEDVKDDLPDAVAAALDVAGDQMEMTGNPTDTDNDGIPDGLDQCPEEGDRGYGLDAEGCPIQEYILENDGPDADGDGVPDSIDRCPTVYGPDLGIETMASVGCPYGDYDFDGVPDAYECMSDDCFDIDGDGIPDSEDRCPTAYGYIGDRDSKGVRTEESRPEDEGAWVSVGENHWYDASGTSSGCPEGDNDQNGIPDNVECGDCEPPDTQDSDGDGVIDQFDACPLIFAPAYYDQDGNFLSDIASGCPPGDEDYDGVPDHLECSGTDCEDHDGDGIPDDEDMCPDHFGFANQEPTSPLWNTSNGCPYGDLDFDGIPDDPGACLDPDQDKVCVEDDQCPTQVGTLENDGCPGPLDTDGDGIPNEYDSCPTKGDEGSGVDEYGCPYILDCSLDSQDYDGDGYVDCLDMCPTIYAQKIPAEFYPPLWQASPPNWHGCPPGDSDYDGIPDGSQYGADRDGDGLLDEDDQCPDQYADRAVCLSGGVCFDRQTNFNGCVYNDEDLDGIPDDKECVGCAPPIDAPELDACLDQDQDGVCVEDDQCPTQAGAPENYGCPVPQDWDGDGVADYEDRCPKIYAPISSNHALPTTLTGVPIQENNEGCPQGDNNFDGVPDDGCKMGEAGCEDWDGDGWIPPQDVCPTVYGKDTWIEGGRTYGGCPPGDADHNGVPDTAGNPPNGTGSLPPEIDACWNHLGQYICDPDYCFDPDQDGVCLEDDNCPSSSGSLTDHGCPYSDTDQDGVLDPDDLCPEEGDVGNGLYSTGCPIPVLVDTDLDGVVDQEDHCPFIAGSLINHGCEGGDWDGDGVADYEDRCPKTFAPISSSYLSGSQTLFPDNNEGCPQGDDDFDGIPDEEECAMGEAGCADWDGDGWISPYDACPTTYGKDYWMEGSIRYGGCPPGDADHNGIPDTSGSPPNGNGPLPPGVGTCWDNNGQYICDPDYCLDPDQDGVCLEDDNCPSSIGSLADHGCPYSDTDQDGVFDQYDDCPEDIGDGYEMYLPGCPIPRSNDIDQDGVMDHEDHCPFEKGTLINHGCKDGDSDGDGVRDSADLCPGIVDSLHGVTPLGCPRIATVRVTSAASDVTADSTVTGDEITIQAPALQLDQTIDKDGDGYVNHIDQCPAHGDEGYGLDLNGCPLPPPAVDSDGDGFADDHDNCPNEGDQGHGLGRTGCPLAPPADSDGDGIVDADDACPNQGDQGAGLRDNGCPVSEKATTDPDGDGIVGALDKCPNQGGDVGLDGCPKTESDSDGDGVPDSQDSCPNHGSDGYGVSKNGCALKPPDSDGDGVADNQDKCPNKGNQGYGLTAEGCPKRPPDSDGDGITDDKDRCPNQGDEGNGVDKGGCPLKKESLPMATPPSQDSSIVPKEDETEDPPPEKETEGRSQDPTPEPN